MLRMDYTMRRLQSSFLIASCLLSFFFLLAAGSSFAFDRQPNSDYHARREALARKVGGVVVLFSATENDGPNDLYGFRQDDNFYYLSGSAEAGGALLIASAADAKGDTPARAYTEILFLPPRNLTQEKWTGPKLGPENPEAPKITGFDHVEDMGQMPNDVAKYVTGAHPVLYTDVDFDGDTSNSLKPMQFMKRFNAYLTFQDVKPMIWSLRTTKDAGEVALIRKAVDASVAAHFAAFKAVKDRKSVV